MLFIRQICEAHAVMSVIARLVSDFHGVRTLEE